MAADKADASAGAQKDPLPSGGDGVEPTSGDPSDSDMVTSPDVGSEGLASGTDSDGDTDSGHEGIATPPVEGQEGDPSTPPLADAGSTAVESTDTGSTSSGPEDARSNDAGHADSGPTDSAAVDAAVSGDGSLGDGGSFDLNDGGATVNGCPEVSTFDCSGELHFPDPGFERVVRWFASVPSGPITQSDTDVIEEIYCDVDCTLSLPVPTIIVSLHGIQCLRNLSALFIADRGHWSISDVCPLKYLASIRKIGIRGHLITDLTPLAHLQNLEYLDVAHNEVRTLGDEYWTAPNLKEIYLAANRLSGVEELSRLPQLSTLYVSDNLVQKIGPAGFEHLANINASGNSGFNIGLTGHLPVLEYLYIGSCKSGSLASLGYSESLRLLDAGGNGLTTFAGVESLVNLENLYADFNPLGSLAALAGVKKLKALRIDYPDGRGTLKTLAGVEALPELTFLSAAGHKLTDITPIAALMKLTTINFRLNQIVSLDPLAGLPELRRISLYKNPITSLDPLIANASFASGAYLEINSTQLDCAAEAENIAILRARGVDVVTDCP